MHEIGVLYQVVRSVEKIAVQNKVEKVAAISLEVGELSGILPVFLEKYYPVVIEQSDCLRDSKLLLEVIPGEAICNKCDTSFNVMKNEGCCPICNSRDKTILGGKDFLIKEIVIYE